MAAVVCALTGNTVDESEAKHGAEISDDLFKLIQSEHPGFTRSSIVSYEALRPYRAKLLTNIVRDEMGELDQIEREVIDSIAHNKLLSENIEETLEEKNSFADSLADGIAGFGGSWAFITVFFVFIAAWMGTNIILLALRGPHAQFDPFPFILLNLILSCLAAIQAPIIMMSQNRVEQKDRVRSEHDYKVNLKAELEIRMLSDKMDHVLIHQNRRVLEILRLHADALEEIQGLLKR
jgi:uncharacterized membrane protein